MARKWKVYYYSESEDEESEIETFINSKDERNQAKILAWIEKLEELGPNLPRPYADILKDGIHELRIKLSGDQVRILYFFCYKDYVILTNHFIKRSDKVPKSEIDKAVKRREIFLKKYSAKEIGKLLS
ncbi:type II toxin-antitoxin system RelE/ParE family toxin [Leptospira yasudae]|uniref:Type II toxin-antitoxin system RelE/ParE family toxin n=1 Tax=Leptospira yasudae TaxID=2202201 RepID=A0A6N4QI77_9LEPT|nr:type II toxin-antitoxin system RelE/ParE family toxin [Leptospira yasudae]TGL80876.1 type II toxin-antitoxin system RelE/ParE family toxin [Leptospira yasudae]TGL81676.1 type II toxin-antitoxin system RelE/ParE family toxin [Leptospira yasudae]TGL88052.1 type II toxin-antitoxin system RelE/ParE family toxin [Leptospira yasudae]